MAAGDSLPLPNQRFRLFPRAVAQAQKGHAHLPQRIHCVLNSQRARLRQMGAAEHRPDGLPQQRVYAAYHIEDSRMSTARQQDDPLPGFQRQAEFIPEIVRNQSGIRQPQEPRRNGFHGFLPGKTGNGIDAGQDFFRPFHRNVRNPLLFQKPPVKARGQVLPAVIAFRVLGCKKAGAGVHPPNRVLLRQIPEPPGVVVVRVAQHHRVQLSQINAQLFGVVQHFFAAAAVKQDDIAEHGMAAHWRYKGVKSTQGSLEDWLAGIRAALETNDDMGLMDQFKMDLVEDEVFVFTPKGDLFKLPKGATVLDFAYAVHTKVGDHCIGAKIGNRNVTIRQELHSGVQVEILTSNNQSPKQDWVNIVKTSKAKSKIRTSLKEMQAGQVTMAKELLERKMKNRKVEMSEPTLMHTMKKLGYKVVTDFYKALNDGTLDVNDVIEEYLARQRHERGEGEKTEVRKAEEFTLNEKLEQRRKAPIQEDVMVIDKDLKGLEFQLARCCQPIYGDEVFGFVTATGGIKIHRTDCPNAPQMRERFGYRIVKARWAGKGGNQYEITLHIIGHDDLGIVNNITSIISKEEKMQMRSISIDSHDGLFSGHLTVMLEDTSRLQQLIRKLQSVKGVKNVTRN